MIKKLAIAGVAVLATLGTSPASAQVTQELCGGPADAVCVLARFELTNGGNNLLMYVANTSTIESAIMGVGVGLPSTFAYGSGFTATYYGYNGVTQTQTAMSGFTPAFNLTGDMNQAVIDLGAQGANPSPWIPGCAGPAGGGGFQTCDRVGATFGNTWDFALFNWDLNGTMIASDLDLIVWGFRAQRMPNDGSLKCEGPGYEALYNGNQGCDLTDIPDDPGGPQETVPEPATMTLLATGLIGMAAARRKRKTAQS